MYSLYICFGSVSALLFLLFGDFRCGMPLFIVNLVIHKYKNSEIDVKC